MGKIKAGILGGFSGKVGPVIGSSWKGISTMKQRPESVANPRTPAQVAQRSRMTQIVAVSRLLLASIIQPLWNPFAQRKSGYNAFVQENIVAFDANGLATPSSFFSSRGSLLGVVGGSVSASAAAGNVDANWTDNSGQADALGSDELTAVVWNETQDRWYTEVGGDTRENPNHLVPTAGIASGDTLHVWLGFARPNKSKVSDSVYFSTTVTA